MQSNELQQRNTQQQQRRIASTSLQLTTTPQTKGNHEEHELYSPKPNSHLPRDDLDIDAPLRSRYLLRCFFILVAPKLDFVL